MLLRSAERGYRDPKEDRLVEREELVKGYEFAKDQCVLFKPEELKVLDAQSSEAIDIIEFIPFEEVPIGDAEVKKAEPEGKIIDLMEALKVGSTRSEARGRSKSRAGAERHSATARQFPSQQPWSTRASRPR